MRAKKLRKRTSPTWIVGKCWLDPSNISGNWLPRSNEVRLRIFALSNDRWLSVWDDKREAWIDRTTLRRQAAIGRIVNLSLNMSAAVALDSMRVTWMTFQPFEAFQVHQTFRSVLLYNLPWQKLPNIKNNTNTDRDLSSNLFHSKKFWYGRNDGSLLQTG